MDGQSPYGCAQCGDDKITQLVRHFTQFEDVERFLDPENELRILLVPEYVFFNKDILTSLKDATNVAAVVVYEPEESQGYPPLKSQKLSVDLPEPNQPYNYYPSDIDPDKIARNVVGDGTKFIFFPFNIFRINNSQFTEIRDLMDRFPDVKFPDISAKDSEQNVPQPARPTAPRYKLQSVGQMYACPPPDDSTDGDNTENNVPEMNSEKCLDDRTCLPIGGHSVWSALRHMDDKIPDAEGKRKILAIMAPMDSNAFFPDFALGASAEISSLAVLMAVAEAVGSYLQKNDETASMSYQPVFFAWNAESWGYAGSSRFLEDVRNFKCEEESNPKYSTKLIDGCSKKYMNNLKFRLFNDTEIIGLNLGHLTNPDLRDLSVQPQFYLHTGEAGPENLITSLEEAFDLTGGSVEVPFGLVTSNSDPSLPPLDATQSFRVLMKEAKLVSITTYDERFNNMFYHSMYDNMSLITSYEPVTMAANSIAAAVIKVAFGIMPDINTISEDRIKEIIECLSSAVNINGCDLANDYLFENASIPYSSEVTPGNYPGSFFPDTRLRDSNKSGFRKLSLVRNFLAYHNRYDIDERVECITDEDCEEYEQKINESSDATEDEYVRRALCAKRVCVASDTYTHNAFGRALSSNNDDQTSFVYKRSAETISQQDASNVQLNAGWTESVWDADLGLCGFVEDTPLFGGLILGAGLAVLAVSFAATIYLDRIMSGKRDEMPFQEAEPLLEPEDYPNTNGQIERTSEVQPVE